MVITDNGNDDNEDGGISDDNWNLKVCDLPPVWPGPFGCLAMVRMAILIMLIE